MALITSCQVARGGKVIGTLPPLEVFSRLQNGEFLSTDHFWYPGMSGWAALSEFESAYARSLSEEARQSQSPPPLPKSKKSGLFQLLFVSFIAGVIIVVLVINFGRSHLDFSSVLQGSIVKPPRASVGFVITDADKEDDAVRRAIARQKEIISDYESHIRLGDVNDEDSKRFEAKSDECLKVVRDWKNTILNDVSTARSDHALRMRIRSNISLSAAEAFEIAKEQIGFRLKAPSTAVYEPLNQSAGFNFVYVEPQGEDYHVYGRVDSQDYDGVIRTKKWVVCMRIKADKPEIYKVRIYDEYGMK